MSSDVSPSPPPAKGEVDLPPEPSLSPLEKCPTGIRGLDEVTEGGLPRNRPTLVCGGPGAGKTLLALEFLVRGATRFGEPGVFIAFEENAEELARNVASLGFDLHDLQERGLIGIDQVRIERHELEVTGEYDLEGLFVRIGYLVERLGARRVALDTLESLFAALPNEAILRAELRRLFRWLKAKELTAVITAERGGNSLSRYGLEEYVSDCVILLDHRIVDEMATRRLRVVKYRGSTHGTNEYPFLIDEEGFSVMPITSVQLNYEVPEGRCGTGIEQLDAMMGGGYPLGSTVLVSGTAGTGKTTLCAAFCDALCRPGRRALYFAFEESPHQILRNMRSVGLDLQPWLDAGLLRIHATRPTLYGLEMHLLALHREVERFAPDGVVIDPMSDMAAAGETPGARSFLMRTIDFLKTRGITALFTSLIPEQAPQGTQAGVSSLMDTWIVLRALEVDGERNRLLHVMKSRGTAHSNRVAEFLITSRGLKLAEPYIGPGTVLTGAARLRQEARDRWEAEERACALEQRRRELERGRLDLHLEIRKLRARLKMQEQELRSLIEIEEREQQEAAAGREALRQGPTPPGPVAGETGRAADKPREAGA